MTPLTKKIGRDLFIVYSRPLMKSMHLKIGMKFDLLVENGEVLAVPLTKKRPVYSRYKLLTRKIKNQSTRNMKYLLRMQKTMACISLK